MTTKHPAEVAAARRARMKRAGWIELRFWVPLILADTLRTMVETLIEGHKK